MNQTAQEMFTLYDDEILSNILENESVRMQLSERLPFGTVENSDHLTLLFEDVVVNGSIADEPLVSPVGVRINACIRKLLHRFWRYFGTGDAAEKSGATQFNGIRKLATKEQTITANDSTYGYYLELIDLARLVSQIKTNSGRPHVLWTSVAGVKNIQRAYFEKGLEPEYVMVNCPDCNGGFTQRPTLAFQGIPIYADETYPAEPEDPDLGSGDVVHKHTDGLSIYAAVLGRDGLHGVVPASFGKKMIRVKEVLNSTTARTVYRAYWPVGLVLENPLGLSRLKFRSHPSVA